MHHQRFTDRVDAGRRLARELSKQRLDRNGLVLGLPRGGVVVAAEVADVLDLPLDVFVVRKLGVPGRPELAMGALAPGNEVIINRDLVNQLYIEPADIGQAIEEERRELERRERLYRGGRPSPATTGRTVVLVDDGLATGATMTAAVKAIRKTHPEKLLVAAPVAADDTAEALSHIADDVICLLTPESFRAVGLWYEQFEQTTDDEVRALLLAAGARHPTGA
ncbi:MAG: phosphoribosyltransferase [Elusimicrobia bacterium]|nr:phosphoribosyltransferase [Elusimicrobiota bacterium]